MGKLNWVILIVLVVSLAGCSLGIPDVHSRTAVGYFTPLHIAAGHGYPPEVRNLIAAGADVNARDNAGWTPLHHAAAFNDPEVVEILLNSGADTEARDNVGAYPRDHARRNRRLRESRVIYRL